MVMTDHRGIKPRRSLVCNFLPAAPSLVVAEIVREGSTEVAVLLEVTADLPSGVCKNRF
jgi:hypothetical protein